jgi:sporulation protein YlmC with PRC-barrel domain
MFAKYAIAGIAGSALLASVAFAQSPSTSSDNTTKNSPTTTMSDTSSTASNPSSFQGNWRTSKLVGLSVYNDKNESVGSINDLLTDKNGKITAVVIGVGGFLGVGEHLVAVSFDKVKFSDQPVAYTGASNAPAKSTTGSTTTTGAATTSTTASKPNPWYPDHAIFNATKDELKAMPEFKYNS